MPKGSSGRIVIEVEPDFKDELYTVLEKEGLNMKSWFIANAQFFLQNRSQLSLNFVREEEPNYKNIRDNNN